MKNENREYYKKKFMHIKLIYLFNIISADLIKKCHFTRKKKQ